MVGIHFAQKWMMTLNGQNGYATSVSQKVICQERNIRLMLVLLTYLFTLLFNYLLASVMFRVHHQHQHLML